MGVHSFCYVLYVFCLSLKIDKQVVKTVVLQVSSAIFSKYFYDFFFLVCCSLPLIYSVPFVLPIKVREGMRRDHTWPAVVC